MSLEEMKTNQSYEKADIEVKCGIGGGGGRFESQICDCVLFKIVVINQFYMLPDAL